MLQNKSRIFAAEESTWFKCHIYNKVKQLTKYTYYGREEFQNSRGR